MGIYGALATAVTGLRAQSFALENISGNIANSQTTGYKRMETAFIDMIPEAPVGRQMPGAVMAYSRSTNDVRGDIVGSSSDTHVALTGKGFFVVSEKIGTSDGQALFNNANYYTRRGDFDLDREGYLVNGAGYYLKGVKIDPGTSNVSSSVPETVKIGNSVIGAQATSRINYALNLPANPAVETMPTAMQANSYSGAALADFGNHTIEGGAVTVYSANGSAAHVVMRWAKIEDADSADPATNDVWQMYYQTESDPEEWVAATGMQAQFAANGTLSHFNGNAVSGNDAVTHQLSNLTVNGKNIANVTFDFGRGGITQFDNASGRANDIEHSQNGYAAGSFLSVAINDSGRVVASYTNGQQIELYQLVVANFNAENQLKRLDGGIFASTAQSGEPIFSLDGGMTGGALEASNTDISEEFTKLIVTQQAYAAGTRIVSTSDEMLREALNMVR